jgi:hypothetical protein
MATFDPTTSVLTWAGILIQGEMDGEHYTAEHYEDRHSLHVGSKGFATVIVNANESGTVVVQLSQKSPSNPLLSAAFAAGTKGPLLLKDLSDTTLASGADAVIAKHAAIKRGKEIIGMEWRFIVPKLRLVAGGDA